APLPPGLLVEPPECRPPEPVPPSVPSPSPPSSPVREPPGASPLVPSPTGPQATSIKDRAVSGAAILRSHMDDPYIHPMGANGGPSRQHTNHLQIHALI